MPRYWIWQSFCIRSEQKNMKKVVFILPIYCYLGVHSHLP
jgi:hypothetical protein